MKKYHFFVLIVLFFTSCKNDIDSNNSEVSVEYYSKLTGIISPFLEYKPRGKLKSSDSISLPYYKVEYDSLKRISEIKYFKNGKRSNDSYFGTHSVTYTYSPDSIIRSYFNVENMKSSMSRHYYGGGDIHKEAFAIDGKGHKKAMSLLDSIDNPITNGFGSFKYEWEVIDENAFIQNQYKKNGERNILTQYFPFKKSLITTDSNGHLFSITNLDTINGKPILNEKAGYASIIFDFDQYGNEKGWGFYDLEGDLTNRKNTLGMEYGYAKVFYEFKWRDKSLGLSDSFSMNFYNSNDEPTLSNDGIHRTLFEFDKLSNLISLSYYGKELENVAPKSLNYHKLNIEYDENGNQTKTMIFDSNGQVLE